VTLGKDPRKHPFIASVRPEAVFGLRVDYGVPAGVSVRDLEANSPAATAFKKLGDRPERWFITQVNGTAVETPAEFHKAVKGQQSVKLTVQDPTEPNPRDREVTIP